MGEQI